MLRFMRRISVGGLLLAMVLSACSSAPATTAPAAPASAPTTAAATAAPAPTTTPTIAPTVAPTNTPAPTATTAPTATPLPASSSACLVGNWELDDMSTYMQSVMAKSGSATATTLVGQTGRLLYTFGADGQAHAEAQDFTMKMSMEVQKLKFDLNITISGSADSQYTATDNTVTYSNGKTKNLKVSATMNGTELFNSTPAELAAMFGVSPDPKYNTFGYQCEGGTLTYTPPIADAQPVVMKRVP